jgi:hypothetical protein
MEKIDEQNNNDVAVIDDIMLRFLSNFTNNVSKNNSDLYSISKENILSNKIEPKINIAFIDFNENTKCLELLNNISKNTIITDIFFASLQNLNGNLFEKIVTPFCSIEKLSSLSFYNLDFNDESIFNAAFKLIKSKNSIDKIFICDNNLRDDFICKLAEQDNVKRSKYLYFTDTKEYKSSKFIFEILNFNSIEILFIKNTLFISNDDSYCLDEIINKEEDLKGNFIFKGLYLNSSLNELTLININLGSKSVLLFESICRNKESKISHINLCYNSINSNHFKEILELLIKYNENSIEYIILNYNLIDDLGMFHLHQFSDKCKESNLKFLDITDNNINDFGAQIIINSINSNLFKIKNFNLSQNKISSKLISEMALTLNNYNRNQILKSNMITVNLDGNSGISRNIYEDIYLNKLLVN